MGNADVEIINSGHAWLGEHPSFWSEEFAYFWSRVRHPSLPSSLPPLFPLSSPSSIPLATTKLTATSVPAPT